MQDLGAVAPFPRGAGPYRLEALADRLGEAGVDAALLTHHRNVLYLAGTAQPCNLLVVPGEEPILFARRFAARAEAETWVGRVVTDPGFGAVRTALGDLGLASGRLGVALDQMPANLATRLGAALPNFEPVDVSPVLAAQRAVKDEDEIEAIRAAALTFLAAHAAMVAELRPGVPEHHLTAAVLGSMRAAGHAGHIHHRRWDAYGATEVIASGDNLSRLSGGPVTISGIGLSVAVPIGASRRRIEPGDSVNIDVGLFVDGYHADIARTYVLGEPGEGVLAAAAAVRKIQDACIAAIEPGVTAASVYEVSAAVAAEAGYADSFQGWGEDRGLYIGHGVGLQIDEAPTLGPGDPTVLEPGMVLAVEPKLISPVFGAVNLEDEVVVRETGAELIESVPRALFVVDGEGSVEALEPAAEGLATRRESKP